VKIRAIFFTVLLIAFKSSAYSSNNSPFKNLVILTDPKEYKEIIFKDINGKNLSLNDFESDIYILNFWATWCLPCKEEMPSLNNLQSKKNLEVIPINVEIQNKKKSQKFFKDLNINNLSIYFDDENNLANLFKLRGIPTTIIFNKKRDEVARILGEFNFTDKKFTDWLENININ
jgi:thiol-disulfide isomerase/thioredoxin|tara:strand:- start:113 stop:634 length:522 start_codon:yes stop_codon:yes gene_type:complete